MDLLITFPLFFSFFFSIYRSLSLVCWPLLQPNQDCLGLHLPTPHQLPYILPRSLHLTRLLIRHQPTDQPSLHRLLHQSHTDHTAHLWPIHLQSFRHITMVALGNSTKNNTPHFDRLQSRWNLFFFFWKKKTE